MEDFEEGIGIGALVVLIIVAVVAIVIAATPAQFGPVKGIVTDKFQLSTDNDWQYTIAYTKIGGGQANFNATMDCGVYQIGQNVTISNENLQQTGGFINQIVLPSYDNCGPS